MSDDISKKSVLVYDNATFVWLAEILVGHFARVGYFNPWEHGFTDGTDLVLGSGLPGIERVRYFWKDYRNYDLIVFTDCYFGDLQEQLREQGCRVWGAGMGAELELARWKTHEQLPQLGLDQNDAKQVVGTTALREYLWEHNRQFIKVSMFRGLGETWFAENAEMAEGKIREYESKYSGGAALIPFIIEAEISDAKEIGYDGYCIEGEYPNMAMFGAERKNKAYFMRACVYDDLPDGVRKINTALTRIMLPGYRQCFHTEVREKDGKHYLLDCTTRFASPAGEILWTMIANPAEILWHGSEGKLVEPEIKQPYGSQLVFYSDWSLEHWQPITFPEQFRGSVHLYDHCQINGQDWVICDHHDNKVGSVVALGDSPEESADACKSIAKQVSGFDLEYDADALDKAVSEMDGT